MSKNNQFYAQQIDGHWFGWDTNAEEVTTDKGSRKLHLVHAISADSLQELENALVAENGPAEYGLTTQPYLAKDGLRVEVVI